MAAESANSTGDDAIALPSHGGLRYISLQVHQHTHIYMTEDQPFTVETSFPIRYAETDAMGIVHHASYIVYFEEGRSAYTRAQGRSYADMETDGFYLAVTDVHARYKKSMRYGQTVTVRCWLSEIKSRTLKFAYELVDADTGEVCVTGETSHICITKDGKVSRFPDNWLK